MFMCHLEDNFARDGMVPSLCKRYVDDTLARMRNTDAAADFLTTLNGLHPSLKFTMEFPADNRIPFIGIEIIKNGTELETRVYRKPTSTGLLLHFPSHFDKCYKTGLLKTLLHRAHALSSTTEAFHEECTKFALFSLDLIIQYVVYFLTVFKDFLNVFKESFFSQFFIAICLFCLSIPKRDLNTKKTPPNIEVCPESLRAMLEY